MSKRVFLTSLTVAVLVSNLAFAQVAPPTSDGYQPPHAVNLHGPQRRLQQFHDQLAITPAQQPQWDAMVAALRDNAAAMRANPARQAMRSGQLDAPQMVRAAADLARQRSDAMGRMIPSVDALYATLSPEQRQVADREIARLIGGGPGARHG